MAGKKTLLLRIIQVWLVLLVLIYAAGFGLRAFRESAGRRAFAGRTDDYRAPTALNPPPEAPFVLRGRAVVADRGTGSLAGRHFDLPRAVRAERPDEVRMVIWLTPGEARYGTYSSGAGAYLRTIRIEYYDLARAELYGVTTLSGPPPVKRISSRLPNAYGRKPTAKEFHDHISALPRELKPRRISRGAGRGETPQPGP